MEQGKNGSVNATAGAVVYCYDEQRVAAFYAKLGGLLEVEKSDGEFVTLESARLQLSFVRMAGRDDAAPPIDPIHRRAETPIRIVLPVASLAAARSDAPSVNGTVDGPEREWEFRGGRHVDAVDPEGNIVSLRETVRRAL